MTTGAAESAGEALAAAFVGSELEEMLDVLDHRQTVRDTDHSSVSEEESRLFEALKIHCQLVDVRHRHDPTQWATDLDGFDLRFESASEINDSLQRSAHGDLIDARFDEMGVERDQLRSTGLWGANLGVALAAKREDGVEVCERLHIVDDGRAAEKTLLGWEGRAHTDLRALALN